MSCIFLGVFRFTKKRNSSLRAGYIVFLGLSVALFLYALVLIGRNDGG